MKNNIFFKKKSDTNITPVEIKLIEKELGIKFPKTYFDFLTQTGFSKILFSQTSFDIPNNGNSVLAVFYGIGEENRMNNIHLLRRQDSLTKDYICIAGDEFGNEICMDNKGQIFFYNEEEDELFIVSDSFDDFISKLYITK